VLDAESVWEMFSYYVPRYWLISKPRIDAMRSEMGDDASWYSNFEYLQRKLSLYSGKKSRNGESISETQLAQFARDETDLESTPLPSSATVTCALTGFS